MKQCIINVSIGSWYPRGMDRLKNSLVDNFEGDFFGWTDLPPGCPPHSEVPDAFVAYAFKDVISKGYTSILWLDASCWAVKAVKPIFDHIEKEGHLFYNNGWNIGQWCKDSALERLYMTREGSFSLPDLTGMFLGVDYTSAKGKMWLDDFIDVAENSPDTLKGPFPSTVPGEVSDDVRVLGHAHEQTVAGALAHHYSMDITPTHFLQVKCPQDAVKENSIVLAAGM